MNKPQIIGEIMKSHLHELKTKIMSDEIEFLQSKGFQITKDSDISLVKSFENRDDIELTSLLKEYKDIHFEKSNDPELIGLLNNTLSILKNASPHTVYAYDTKEGAVQDVALKKLEMLIERIK